MSIVFNKDDKAFFTEYCRPERPLGRFFLDLQDKLEAHKQRALTPGDTDYQKGMAVGIQEIIDLKDTLIAPDTQETGAER